MNKPFENLLCDDEELNFLKRAFESITEATRVLKESNDSVIPEGLARWERSEKKHSMWNSTSGHSDT